jgi:hypothetical protein
MDPAAGSFGTRRWEMGSRVTRTNVVTAAPICALSTPMGSDFHQLS